MGTSIHCTNNHTCSATVANMPTSYEGHCHCGQTAWTADIDTERYVLCHCGACKLMSGGEFTLNQIIPKSAFKLTKGNLNKYTYKGDSGNSVDCFFCPNCTSNPYHHQHIMGDNIVIRTSLLWKSSMPSGQSGFRRRVTIA